MYGGSNTFLVVLGAACLCQWTCVLEVQKDNLKTRTIASLFCAEAVTDNCARPNIFAEVILRKEDNKK